MVDVVLIHSNFRGRKIAFVNIDPPAGIAYIAAILEQNGIKVKIIDPVPEGLEMEDVCKKIAEIKPRIVGLTCLTSYRHDTFELATRIKSANPDCKILVGGAHVTPLDRITLERIRDIDAIVRGEGEYACLEYVNAIFAAQTLENIMGLTYRGNGGEIRRNPDRPLIDDLNTLPFPAYHLFEKFGDYPELIEVPPEYKGLKHVGIVSSRGCPFKCVYCSSVSVMKRKFRGRSAANVVDEIQYLNDRFGVQYVRFYDDNFTANKNRVIEICDEIIKRGLNIKWRCESRIDGTDREMLQRMAEAGCHQVEYGVETGSEDVMKNINKKIRLDKVPVVAQMCKEYGLEAKAFIMVGLPGETVKDFRKTIEISKYFDYCGIAQLMIFPGSPMYDDMKSKNRIDDEIWFKTDLSQNEIMKDVPIYTDSFSEEQGMRLKAIFYEEHPNYQQKKSLLKKIMKASNFKYIFKPQRFLQMIGKKLKSYRDYKRTQNDLFGK
jgi:radical SAM superfamily enzyme YgiQ (UPF0313 family)